MTNAARIKDIGPVMQLAFAPEDFDAAIRYWTQTMGVGPFFILENVALGDLKYRGMPSDFVFSMALAYWGDIQIELIKPENDAPNMYADHIGTGLHHTCILTDDMAKAREIVAQSGASILVEGTFGEDGLVIYAETGGGPGTIVEILQPATGSDALFDMIRDAARDWDGSDPVRMLG